MNPGSLGSVREKFSLTQMYGAEDPLIALTVRWPERLTINQ